MVGKVPVNGFLDGFKGIEQINVLFEGKVIALSKFFSGKHGFKIIFHDTILP